MPKAAERQRKPALEKKSGRRHPVDLKAAIVAGLLQGVSPQQLALDHDVAERTIQDWAKHLGGINALRQGRLDDLLYQTMTENLETLAAQSRFFRERGWLEKQNAADCAVLYGVVSDKTVRVLAAIERAQAGRDLERVGD